MPSRASASRAARASSYVASVLTDRSQHAGVDEAAYGVRMPPGSSGSRVTIRTAPSPAVSSASTDAGSGTASEPGW